MALQSLGGERRKKRMHLAAAKESLKECQGAELKTKDGESCQLEVPTTIRHGSDCTGLGTDRLALSLLGVEFTSVFASENQESARRIYKSLHDSATTTLYKDCTARATPSKVDLYISGPPCQPWSNMGDHGGLEDCDHRGLVFYHVLEYVRRQQPRAVIIENVTGLLHHHACEFAEVVRILKACKYEVSWDVLQSMEHGLPQSRPRIYIIGIRSDSIANTFKYPQKVNTPHIDKFLDQKPCKKKFCSSSATAKRNYKSALRDMRKREVNPKKIPVLIDLQASKTYTSCRVGGVPCMTATRCSQGGWYISSQGRMTNLHEMGRLQGFTTEHVDKMVASGQLENRVAYSIGNAMSLNVIYRLLPRVLWAAGLVAVKPCDVWKHHRKVKTHRLPDGMYNNDVVEDEL